MTATGLAILLGADVGSALVTQLLMVRQPILIPLLLIVGVVVFLRGEGSNTRQIGRILIGLALIFVSLDMIRSATEPLISNPGTQAIMAYLGRDLLTAFLIGAVFAWGFTPALRRCCYLSPWPGNPYCRPRPPQP